MTEQSGAEGLFMGLLFAGVIFFAGMIAGLFLWWLLLIRWWCG